MSLTLGPLARIRNPEDSLLHADLRPPGRYGAEPRRELRLYGAELRALAGHVYAVTDVLVESFDPQFYGEFTRDNGG